MKKKCDLIKLKHFYYEYIKKLIKWYVNWVLFLEQQQKKRTLKKLF